MGNTSSSGGPSNTDGHPATDAMNNGSNNSNSIPEEPSWSLPSSQSDQQWLQACMDEMFDKDFMRKSFHGPDIAMTGPFVGSQSPSAKEDNNKDDSSAPSKNMEEAEALADAVACLAYPFDATARRMTVSRLTDGLTRQCREEDPFTTTVAQRIHFLRCMHAAMVRAWPRQQQKQQQQLEDKEDSTENELLSRVLRDIGADEEDEEEQQEQDESIRRRRRRRRKPSSKKKDNKVIAAKKSTQAVSNTDAENVEKKGLSHTVRMGLTLFFTMLECMQQDGACTPEQYAELMREMVPVVATLAPPQPFGHHLGQEKLQQQQQAKGDDDENSNNAQLPKIGVLNEICDFLYRSSMGRKYYGDSIKSSAIDDELLFSSTKKSTPLLLSSSSSSIPNMKELKKNSASTNPIKKKGEEKSYEALPVTPQERTRALEALYSLACSRASLVDFLLCVRVLLEDVTESCEGQHTSSGVLMELFDDNSTSNNNYNNVSNNLLKVNTGYSEAMSPSTSPTINADIGERSPDSDHAKMSKRGWRTVDEITSIAGTTTSDTTTTTNLVGENKEECSDDCVGSSGAIASASNVAAACNNTPIVPPKNGRKASPSNPACNNNNNNNNEEARSPREWRIRQQNAMGVNIPTLQPHHNNDKALEMLHLSEKVAALSEINCRALFKAQSLGGKTEQVEVWSFGQNSYGELAQGDTVTRKQPKKATVLNEKDVVQVAAGNEHTVVLTRSGKVYAVGYNDNGQCGQGNTGRVAHLSNIEALNGKNVTQVHAYNGCEHTLCVTGEGALYSFGYNYRGQLGHGNTASLSSPQLVPGFGLPGRRVKYVSCSYYHSVVATDSGALFTFGRNDFGQLGHGDTVDRKEPTKVEGIPPNEMVTSVACGQYHTITSVTSGSVYACGKNDYGQIGLKLPEAHRRITLVRFFGGKKVSASPEEECDTFITELRCGYYHTIALSSSGKVWAFGRNDYGQLGIGNATQKVFVPREVEDLDGKTSVVTRIAAGCYHSIAVDETNALYVFGRNNHGQLGCGESTEKHSPWPVKSLGCPRIADIAAGFYHTIILTGGEDQMDEREDEETLLFASDTEEQLRTPVLLQKEDCLNNRSGTLAPFQVAFMTLLSLDRMAVFHRGRQDRVHKWRGQKGCYPALDPYSAIERLNDKVELPPADVPFCIDQSPRTLALLVYIAKLCQNQLNRLSESNKPGEGVDDCRIWSYLFLASFRLIRSNVAQILWSGNGAAIQREMSLINNNRVNEKPLVVKALDEVHKFALETIESPPLMADASVVEVAQGLASEVLMTGLELFYPTQELQVQLLASLMAEESTVDDEEEEETTVNGILDDSDDSSTQQNVMRFSPRSPLMKFKSFSPVGINKNGLKKYLLEPLLKRLSDDELVSAMVPYYSNKLLLPTTPCARGVVQRAIGENSSNNNNSQQASVALLSSLLSSLVKQISSQATRKIRNLNVGRESFIQPPSSPHAVISRKNGFLQLLLSLQKHLLSWAANSWHPTEEPSNIEQISQNIDDLLGRWILAEEHGSVDANSSPPATVFDGDGPSTCSLVSVGTTADGSSNSAGNCFSGFAWNYNKNSNNSTSWDCLLRYSELVFRKCNIELLQLLDEAEQYVQQQSYPMMEKLISTLGTTSVVSGVLPSLVVGLSLFAQRTFFATKLLPKVMSTLELVDKVCSMLPVVVESDMVYRQASDRFGANSNAEDKKDPSKKESETSNPTGENGKKRVEEAINTSSLPWLLQLEKALAALGGRLASTLVVGRVEGDRHNGELGLAMFPGSDGEEKQILRDSYTMWRDCVLFEGGFDNYILSSIHTADGLLFFGSEDDVSFVAEEEEEGKEDEDVVIPVPSSPQKRQRQDKHHSSSSSLVVTDNLIITTNPSYAYLTSSQSHEGFLKLLISNIDDEKGDLLCKSMVGTIRSTYGKKNFAYNMSLLQGRGNGGIDAKAMETVERSIFASVLKNSGLLLEAILYTRVLSVALKGGNSIERPDPPARLVDCFKACANVRTHLVRLRSQFMSNGGAEDSTSFADVCACYTSRAQFLLLFAPSSQFVKPKSRPKSKWDIVRSVFWSMVQWKRAAKEASQCRETLSRPHSDNQFVNLVVRFVKCPVDVTVDGSQVPSSPTKGKPSSPTKRRKQLLQQQYFDVSVLFSMIVNNCRRAYLRDCGLKAFRHLLSVPTLASPRTDILRYLAPSLRSAVEEVELGKEDGSGEKMEKKASHYASCLGAIGPQLLLRVHKCFVSLYEDLAYALKNALAENSDACVQERLLLLDAWAMNIGPVDLDLLSKTGLLEVLQGALKIDQEVRDSKDDSFDTLRKKQIGKAAWLLFRLLLAQVGEGKDEQEISKLLEVLYSEMNSALELMLPSDKGGSGKQSMQQQAQTNTHTKELVTEPIRLNSVGGGMVIQSSEFMFDADSSSDSDQAVDDFSITVWVCIDRKSIGLDRILFMKGGSELQAPIVSIRDSDNRVEVWCADRTNLSERIVSKEPLEVNVWTHIAVVCENGKLRLFVQGVLDGQQQDPMMMMLIEAANGNKKMNICLGKPGMELFNPSVKMMLGGIEGYLAQLKYHNRALSPIHIHIMNEQGPPKHSKIRDRHCFQLLVVQQTLTENKLGKLCLARPRWLELYAKIFKFGTPRVQQAVLRLWRVLFPLLTPAEIAPYLLPILIGPPEEGHEQQNAGDLIDYLLAQIGVGVWTGDRDTTVADDDSTRSDDGGEKDNNHTTVNTDAKISKKSKLKNKFDLSCDTGVAGDDSGYVPSPSSLLSKKREEMEVQTSIEGSGESAHHSFALSSELIMLVRLLSTSGGMWSTVLSERMTEAMTDISEKFVSPKHAAQEKKGNEELLDMHALRSVGTLAVLGGHTESLRVGGRVAMTHADITATVVAFDSGSSTDKTAADGACALVVMTEPGEENNEAEDEVSEQQQQAPTSPKRSMRAVRMNTEELVPIPEFRSPFASLSPKKKKNDDHNMSFNVLVDDDDDDEEKKSADAVENSKIESDPEEETKTKDLPKRLEASFFLLLQHLFVEPEVNQNDRFSVLLAQCRARTLKVLHEMLQTQDCNFEQLFEKCSDDHTILSALMTLASQPLNQDKFVTLDGIEVRASVLRQRLHQLRVDRVKSPFKKVEGRGSDEVTNRSSAERKDDINALMYSDDDEEEELVDDFDNSEEDDEDEDEEDTHAIRVSPTVLVDEEDSDELFGDELDDEDEDDEDEDEGGDVMLQAATSNTTSSRSSTGPPSYLVEELVSMGFPEEWCVIALRVQGFDLIAASTWIVDNLDMLSQTPMSDLVGATETIFEDSSINSGAPFNSTAVDEEKSSDLLNETSTSLGEEKKQQQQQQQPPRGSVASKQKQERKRLARAKASMREMKSEAFNQLEEELGSSVFDDNSFRMDSSASYQYGYSCGALGLYNGLHAEGSQQESAREAFRSEISCLSFSQLETLCCEMEQELSILYSRSCLVVLLQRWRQWPDNGASFEVFVNGHEELLVSFLRVVLFRGPQLMPSYEVSMLANSSRGQNLLLSADLPGLLPIEQPIEGSLAQLSLLFPTIGDGFNDMFPTPPGVCSKSGEETAKKKNKKQANGAASSVINLLIQATLPAMQQLVRKELNETITTGNLCATLLAASLQDLHDAGSKEEYIDREWGIRSLFLTDKAAKTESNVEFSSFLIGLLQIEGYEEAFSVDCFNRMLEILGSPNMPLKYVAIQVLIAILRQWNVQLKDSKEATLVRDRVAVVRRLPQERLVRLCERRAELEERCGRVFFSKYVAKLTELISLQKELIASTEEGEAEGKSSEGTDTCGDPVSCAKCELTNLDVWFTSLKNKENTVCIGCLDTEGNNVMVQQYSSRELGRDCGCGNQFLDGDRSCVLCKEKSAPIQCSVCPEVHLCVSCLGQDSPIALAALHDCQHCLVYKPCCEDVLTSQRNALSLATVSGLTVTKTTCDSIFINFTLPSRLDEKVYTVFVEATTSKGEIVCSQQLSVNLSKDSMSHVLTELSPNTTHSIKVYLKYKKVALSQPKTIKTKTKDKIAFTFDKYNSGPNIVISEKGLVAEFNAIESWSTVLGTDGFVNGVSEWQVRIDETDSPYMFIGVASRKACLTTFLGGDEHGYGYIGDRALYHKRNRVNVYGERFGQGDVVGVKLDMDNGTLSFSRNGKDLGVGFEGLTGRLYPAFAFYSGVQRITLLRKTVQCAEQLRGFPFQGQRNDLQEALKSFHVLEKFAERKCVQSVLDDAFELFEDWIQDRKVRKMTRLGIELDITKENSVRSRVQSNLGSGVVVGTGHGCTWVDLDGVEGTWFVKDEKTLTVTEETKQSDEENVYDEFRLSRGRFVDYAASPQWTLLQDQALIGEVSLLCERKGVHPFNVTPKMFETEVLAPCKLRARNLANRTVDMMEKERTLRFESRLEDAKMGGARLAVLKVVNDHFQRVLPFVGSCFGGGGGQIFNNSAVLTSSSTNSKVSYHQVCGISTMGQKLRYLRTLLFSTTKLALLRGVIDSSAFIPAKKEDDYEHPDELPQIQLNRPKATFSRTLPDAESRLSYSMFGQTFDAIHFLDPKTLRIEYSHPMDEGQSRSFTVKFEAEGVQDHGGPYREVWTQWSAELTSTTVNEDGSADDTTPDFATVKEDVGDSGGSGSALSIDTSAQEGSQHLVCVLPLLHPCPNRLHGVGANREKFVIRPGSSGSSGSGAHLLMEMYNFLGQLTGIALRTKTNLNIPLASTIWKPLVSESLNINDLHDIDHSTVALIESLCTEKDPDVLQAMLDEINWSARLSDGTELLLYPDGNKTKVNAGSCEQYTKVLLEARLRESEHAISAIRDGLCSVIPSTILPLFTAEELERLVVGSNEMNIELLKSVTEYDDDLSENDPHIQSLWRVLEGFSNLERQRFIRFVWARSQLPSCARDFSQKFKIQAAASEAARESPDQWLPKAHTCFFALSLPKYSSDKVMREKLLFAISNCMEMDADFQLTESEVSGWDTINPNSASRSTGLSSVSGN